MERKKEALGALADASQGHGQEGHTEIRLAPAKPEYNEDERNNREAPSLGASASARENFSVQADGVYYLEYDKQAGERVAVWQCSPLWAEAQTRDADGRNWGLLLVVQDPVGVRHRWAMPMSLMAGNGNAYREELFRLGLRMAHNGQKRLHEYLTSARPEKFVLCVSRMGWHGGRYVLLDTTYGDTSGEEVALQNSSVDNVFRLAGSLSGWQEQVGRFCEGNSRLAFAVSVAFAGPLLHLFRQESGGFHLTSNSSAGKSTLMQVAGSVCGGGGQSGFVRRWRITDNALEAVAAAHNDALLCLDEIGQVSARVAAETAYMLANGQGKGRAYKDGTARPVTEWRLLFLSSGELTLEQKIQEEGRRYMAGQAVRVVDIPADAGAGLGVFEALHGFQDGKALAEHLQQASCTHYGYPFRRYLEQLTADPSSGKAVVESWVQRFIGTAYPQNADGQVKRVANRFALCAGAGELATVFGILPWEPGTALWAARHCFRAWVLQRGGVGAAEFREALAQVRSFLEAHGASRFESWDKSGERIVNRVGFRRQEGEQVHYLIFPDAFKNELCKGMNHKAVARYLNEQGYLVPGDGANLAKVYRLPREGTSARLYTITAAILQGGEDEHLSNEKE